MSRILIAADGQWFEELRAVAYYSESDVEKSVLKHAASIFPHHFVFPFKKSVASERASSAKRPDLALIRRDFKAWTVVEVEIEGHAITHVVEQTRVFAQGNYNAEEMAEYARKQLKRHCRKATSLTRLRGLFSNYAPSVLVITDGPTADWQHHLTKEGVDLCVFEVYKSVRGHHVYRTSGQYPEVVADEAHCRAHEAIANVLEVVGQFKFEKLPKGKPIEVAYDEILTRWTLFEEAGRQYLRFVGKSNPLAPNASYSLFRDKSRKYYFRRS